MIKQCPTDWPIKTTINVTGFSIFLESLGKSQRDCKGGDGGDGGGGGGGVGTNGQKETASSNMVKQSFFHLGALGGEGVAGCGSDWRTGVNGDPWAQCAHLCEETEVENCTSPILISQGKNKNEKVLNWLSGRTAINR